mmetsp:Transcript_57126/g.144895  ORF Transcript_57126/g.144895 Transcript_57126/m.144895 type:complete len:97 (+) Transcript_57126:540-830(+)
MHLPHTRNITFPTPAAAATAPPEETRAGTAARNGVRWPGKSHLHWAETADKQATATQGSVRVERWRPILQGPRAGHAQAAPGKASRTKLRADCDET